MENYFSNFRNKHKNEGFLFPPLSDKETLMKFKIRLIHSGKESLFNEI